MKDLEYAYANARIRANERYMVTNSDLANLVGAASYEDAIGFLSKKNWIKCNSEDVKDIITAQSEYVWHLLNECVPDKQVLQILTASNDFFNLKAAINCLFSELDASLFYVHPTSLDLQNLTQKVKAHEFDFLKGKMGEALAKAYEVVAKTQNGQNAEAIIDKAALDYISEISGKANCNLTKQISDLLCAIANIKTAIRCARTNKSIDFIKMSIGNCDTLNTNLLTIAASQSPQDVFDYLKTTKYSQAVALLENSTTAFEKWCDDQIITLAKDSKYVSFGFAPICAFFYAKQMEIKTVRMILMAKKTGISEDEIKERVRTLYA